MFPYPMEKSHLDDSEGPSCPPVGVTVTLPDSVVFLEAPQVARWDAAGRVGSNTLYTVSVVGKNEKKKVARFRKGGTEKSWTLKLVVHQGKQWRTDGINDVSYEEAEARISFTMDSFQPVVLMQETYANFPFQSWELRPLGQDSALFTVSGALIKLSVTIQVRDRREL